MIYKILLILLLPVNAVIAQDGVAPQCEVKDIGVISSNIPHGRAYIPKTITTKGFIGSHSINNYGWIFTLTLNQIGYVQPR